jgi:hypothetical protein
MSEDGSGQHVRQTPRRTGQVHIVDFTILVRVPGRAAAARVYTDPEREEAVRYAAEVGGDVVPLPLSPLTVVPRICDFRPVWPGLPDVEADIPTDNQPPPGKAERRYEF